jgi:quercetin dioxygenase-like cupin family protein
MTHPGTILSALLAFVAFPVAAHDPAMSDLPQIPGAKNARITLVYQHDIPGAPGKSLKGVLVEYGPGGYSPAHIHAKSAIIYATVLQGEVLSQINAGQVKKYAAGENWTELPGDYHGVSANASDMAPSKILAVFVVDADDTELTKPAPEPR